eukprot:12197470-Alexandrium_andersonii.AAC.1
MGDLVSHLASACRCQRRQADAASATAMALVAGLELRAAWAFYRRVSQQLTPRAPLAGEDSGIHIVVADHP